MAALLTSETIPIVLSAVTLAVVSWAVVLLLKGTRDSDRGEDHGALLRDEFQRARESNEKSDALLREEINKRLDSANETLSKTLVAQLKSGSDQQASLLRELRVSNEKKLEQMRQTVDEKLQGTLEKRLGGAFKQVQEQLESVHKGLGEMKQLAEDVGDFKKVLTNVKSRGTWGEVQLRSILEDMLTPTQWDMNICPIPGSNKQVEFVIRLPGSDTQDQVWLPVDAKFPQEDYRRLQEAQNRADPDAVEAAAKGLDNAIIKAATDIRDKYIEPPHTTDFGILFLPTEGLYAEALRRPKIEDALQRLRITLAGPTTLAAILNALRVGFHTLAIEKRSSEVWEILGAVKAEFGKFGETLDKLKKQLGTAQKTIEDDIGTRTRAMERKLRKVEELPESESLPLLQQDERPFSADLAEPTE